jgi:predicted Zn-dependent peptidase
VIRPNGLLTTTSRKVSQPMTSPIYDSGREWACRTTTLENGVRVVTESKPNSRAVSIGVLVDAGPRDEPPGRHGLAHLTEHATFLGTASRDAVRISRLIDEAGGQMGAFTARDYTCYHATVLDDYLTYVVDLLGDILLDSTYPNDAVERQKQTILREISAGCDAPAHLAQSLLRSAAWPNHPLGEPIEGDPGEVAKLVREDIIYFVQANYSSDRMIVAASGGVDHDDLVAHVRDAMWRLTPTAPRAPVARPGMFRSDIVLHEASTTQVYFAIGLDAGPYTDQDRYALHLFNILLGGGMSSRLFRRIREELGLTYDIRTEYLAYRDGGLFLIEGSTAREHLVTALGRIFRELTVLASGQDPIDEEELWKAKMQARGMHLIASEDVDTCMSRLATQTFYFGRPIPAGEVLAEIERVDLPALWKLSESWLAQGFDRMSLGIVGPDLRTLRNDWKKRGFPGKGGPW